MFLYNEMVSLVFLIWAASTVCVMGCFLRYYISYYSDIVQNNRYYYNTDLTVLNLPATNSYSWSKGVFSCDLLAPQFLHPKHSFHVEHQKRESPEESYKSRNASPAMIIPKFPALVTAAMAQWKTHYARTEYSFAGYTREIRPTDVRVHRGQPQN